MIDSNQSWSFEQAKQSLQLLQQYSPLFAEEPLAADAPLDQWEQLAKASSIPIAGGENIYGVDQFIRMADAGMSVLQPDVAKWGGVTGALALAKAKPEDVKLWPHFMGTALGQMASLAITAIVGKGSVCEMDVNKNPLRTELCGDVMNINEGRVKLHAGAGLVTEPTSHSLAKFRVAR
jgi:L-alanine-DL-glutamate epimerase-like enolase superfamily enzyme